MGKHGDPPRKGHNLKPKMGRRHGQLMWIK